MTRAPSHRPDFRDAIFFADAMPADMRGSGIGFAAWNDGVEF